MITTRTFLASQLSASTRFAANCIAAAISGFLSKASLRAAVAASCESYRQQAVKNNFPAVFAEILQAGVRPHAKHHPAICCHSPYQRISCHLPVRLCWQNKLPPVHHIQHADEASEPTFQRRLETIESGNHYSILCRLYHRHKVIFGGNTAISLKDANGAY